MRVASGRVRVNISGVQGILRKEIEGWQAPFYTFRRALSLALGRQDNLNRHKQLRNYNKPMAITSRHREWNWSNSGLEQALLGYLTSGPWWR